MIKVKQDIEYGRSHTNSKERVSQELPSKRSDTIRQFIPSATYAAIEIEGNELLIAETGSETSVTQTNCGSQEDAQAEILSWAEDISHERHHKLIAVDVRGDGQLKTMIPHLWLQEDIVPYISGSHEEGETTSIEDLTKEVASRFDKNNIVRIPLSTENEVEISELVTLEDYQKTASQEDFALLTELAREFKGKKLVFINATPQGGGVALMRHALIRLLRLLDVDVHWYVLIPSQQAFDITKQKFHNVLQAVAGKDVRLTAADKEVYNAWMKVNADAFEAIFQQADALVIDDPQPSGLIPYIRAANPRARIIYRSHIQIVADLASTPGTPQRTTWSFIWDNVQDADCFVSHPMQEFIPTDVPEEKIVYMPATTDPLDGLNKPLSEGQMAYYLTLFNKFLLEAGQAPLDLTRPYIIQVARFDPSKGIPDVIESYRKLREMLEQNNQAVPQLVLTGNGSIDDPDRLPVLNMVLDLLRSETYAHLADDVKVVGLPHIDQLLNTLLRKSEVVLQLSTKEGFEVKVTEALMKGKPVIAYKTGGIPLQIQDDITEYLVDVGNTTQVAAHLYDLLTNQGKYQQMSDAAAQLASKEYLTVPNAICWLFLALHLLKEGKIEGHYQWVKALAEKYAGIQSALLS